MAFPEPELIWIAAKKALNLQAPLLEALTHLLAGALAKDLRNQPVAIVKVRSNSVTSETWTVSTFGPALAMPGAVTSDQLQNLVSTFGKHVGRVFVLNLDDPLALPPSWVFQSGIRFDRIVFLTDHIPKAISPALQGLLKHILVTDTGVYYSSIVASVIGPPQPATFPQGWLPGNAPDFRVRRMDGKANVNASPPDGNAARLFRDACRLGFDLETILAQWLARTPTTAFVDQVSGDDAQRAHRWGRAASNRRVGVAVSGGGASAYRAKTVFEQLAIGNPVVPVDVVAGLSGGAVVGAYYAERKFIGLERVVSLGPFLQAALPVVLLSSWPLQAVIDFDLGSPRVQDAEIRFAPVTTELLANGPPHSAVVVEGTLGSAVRASGCLPPAFAPMPRNGSRYTDGGAAAVVPAQILRDCGADLSLAVNILPGAKASNPLDMIPVIGKVLHDWTLCGRLLDVYAWYAYMWSQASRTSGELADVYVEFKPQQIAFVESVLFVAARWIARKGRRDTSIVPDLNDLRNKWSLMQLP